MRRYILTVTTSGRTFTAGYSALFDSLEVIGRPRIHPETRVTLKSVWVPA
jgi:hypothetical protein